MNIQHKSGLKCNTPEGSLFGNEMCEDEEDLYCILLHVVEVIGLNSRKVERGVADRYKIILNASLKGLKFEVTGCSMENTTLFNSNNVWEASLSDIKKMKTENHPVKLQFFIEFGNSEYPQREMIASLMLPLRSIPSIETLRILKTKLHWHRLSAVNLEWRENKPEVQLLLVVARRALIDIEAIGALLCPAFKGDGADSSNETHAMLQSQNDIYVQVVEGTEMLKVGNDDERDCQTLLMYITFKQVRKLRSLFELDKVRQEHEIMFQYDLLGSIGQTDKIILHRNADSFSVNERLSIKFRTLLPSLRKYMQRVFYIPINLFMNGTIVASYTVCLSKYLPEEDEYFDSNKLHDFTGCFAFDRLYLKTPLSPRAAKPTVDFIFNLERIDMQVLPTKQQTSTAVEFDFAYNNMEEIALYYPAMEAQHLILPLNKYMHFEQRSMSGCNIKELDMVHQYEVANIRNVDDEIQAQHLNAEGISLIRSAASIVSPKLQKKEFQDIGVGTELLTFVDAAVNADLKESILMHTVGINTEPELQTAPANCANVDTESLTFKVVEELQAWKEQQIQNFVNEMQRKEAECLANLDKKWQQQRAVLNARLQSKIKKCELLNKQLEKAYADSAANTANNQERCHIVATLKKELESSYATRFQELDGKLQNLSALLLQKGTESQAHNKDMESENGKLEQQNSLLQKRIETLEKQLTSITEKHLSSEHLKSMLSEMRIQNDRYAELEKDKLFYKEQWKQQTREVQKLSLLFLEKQKHSLKNEMSTGFEIRLEDILNEEQEELVSDKTELNSIKNILYNALECELSDEDDIPEVEGK